MNRENFAPPETTASSPLKVYCDAAVNHDSGLAAVGWHICNHNGATIHIEGEHIGTGYTTMTAEQEAIKRILGELARWRKIQHVVVCTDCQPAKGRLERPGVGLEQDSFDNISLKWVPREQNRVADSIAEKWIHYQAERQTIGGRPAYGMTD